MPAVKGPPPTHTKAHRRRGGIRFRGLRGTSRTGGGWPPEEPMGALFVITSEPLWWSVRSSSKSDWLKIDKSEMPPPSEPHDSGPRGGGGGGGNGPGKRGVPGKPLWYRPRSGP